MQSIHFNEQSRLGNMGKRLQISAQCNYYFIGITHFQASVKIIKSGSISLGGKKLASSFLHENLPIFPHTLTIIPFWER